MVIAHLVPKINDTIDDRDIEDWSANEMQDWLLLASSLNSAAGSKLLKRLLGVLLSEYCDGCSRKKCERDDPWAYIIASIDPQVASKVAVPLPVVLELVTGRKCSDCEFEYKYRAGRSK